MSFARFKNFLSAPPVCMGLYYEIHILASSSLNAIVKNTFIIKIWTCYARYIYLYWSSALYQTKHDVIQPTIIPRNRSICTWLVKSVRFTSNILRTKWKQRRQACCIHVGTLSLISFMLIIQAMYKFLYRICSLSILYATFLLHVHFENALYKMLYVWVCM